MLIGEDDRGGAGLEVVDGGTCGIEGKELLRVGGVLMGGGGEWGFGRWPTGS